MQVLGGIVLAIALAIGFGAFGFFLIGFAGLIIGGILGLLFALPGKSYWSFRGHTSGGDLVAGDDSKAGGFGWGGDTKGKVETGDSSSWGSGGGSSWGGGDSGGGGSSSSSSSD